MRFSTVVATALVAAAPSLQASQSYKTYGGNAIIVNNCDFPLHLWSVDEANKPSDSDYEVVPAKSNWTEPLRVPKQDCNCGVSIKLSKETTQSRPILQFEYTIAEASSQSNMFMSYDISFVDCSTATPSIAAIDGYDVFTGTNCPAWSEGISITGSSSECPTMACAAGDFCYLDAYFEPEPAKLLGVQPVRQCPNGDLTSDIILTTCTSSQSSGDSSSDSSSSSSQAAPSPSSSSSSSPSPSPSPSSSSSSSAAPSSSDAASVVAAEFAPVVTSSSSATPTPEVTSAPVIQAAIKTDIVYTTVVTTMYVDTSGARVNADGSRYLGRRFAA